MKTSMSTEAFLNEAISTLKYQLPEIHRLTQVDYAARAILKLWQEGCSFEDLEKPMNVLAILLADKK